METIVEIEQSFSLAYILTIYKTPVWKYTLWNDYKKNLGFMAGSSAYPRAIIKIGGVAIDFTEYLKVPSKETCLLYERAWAMEGNTLYIHFQNHDPPFFFYSLKSGILYGFTGLEPVKIGDMQYLPDLLQIPDIQESADRLKYARMKFLSGSVKLNNDKGQSDGILAVFGNNINILIRDGDDLELLHQFYISKYSIDSKSADFTCKDRREKLSFSCPDTNYGSEAYPYIDKKYLGKVIQDAYGKCRNIPGACLNEGQIYADPGLADSQSEDRFNNWFTFKFARKITSIETIEAKMRDESGNDLWVEIYPGLGVRGNGTGIYAYNPSNPNRPAIHYEEGTIDIWWGNALKPNPGHLYNRGGDANEVRASGVFCPQTSPGDIVKDILMHYGNFQFDEGYFNVREWESELGALPDIGIFLDAKKSAYEWIEKIQNGCLLGWQMFIYKDLFTARLDDQNREETFEIRPAEIENIHGIEVELDGENYATYTDISYQQDYSEKTAGHVIDKSMQKSIMDLYQYEEGYVNDSLLCEEEDAREKGQLILRDFSVVRPILRGIRLRGRRWFSLRVYDTGRIDFTIELPERMKALQPFMKDRKFFGRLRCQIISRKISPKEEMVEIDVRQRDWNATDITGEYPDEECYIAEYDNMYADTPGGAFECIVDGGGVDGYD